MDFKLIPQYKLTRRERRLIRKFVKDHPSKSETNPVVVVEGKWTLYWEDDEANVVGLHKEELDHWYTRWTSDSQRVKISYINEGQIDHEAETVGVLGFDAGPATTFTIPKDRVPPGHHTGETIPGTKSISATESTISGADESEGTPA